MPLVQKIHDELKGRSDVRILALNGGQDDRERIESYWKDSGFSFDALMDAGERGSNTRALGVAAFPTNIVVGPDGKVLHASVGFDEARIRELLGVQASAQ